jgi:hypothetical protein
MLANSIPIYCGNPKIEKNFTTNSFINCNDYSSFEKVIKKVIEIDSNDEVYKNILKEPYYKNNKIPKDVYENNLVKRLKFIKKNIGNVIPVARRKIFLNNHYKKPKIYEIKHMSKIILRIYKSINREYLYLKYVNIPSFLKKLFKYK